jgi:hypothetical protein
VDRTRVWLAVSPIVVAGVLVSHALAYRLTGTPTGSLHGYLDHAPQVLLVVALVGLLVAGLASRMSALAAWPFPVAALATFAAQEHVERLAHTGELPSLFDSPAFLVGLLLQLPVALVVWVAARWLLGALVETRVRRPRLPRLSLPVLAPRTVDVCGVPIRPLPGRGPPRLRRS